jgi:hypothetical protein
MMRERRLDQAQPNSPRGPDYRVRRSAGLRRCTDGLGRPRQLHSLVPSVLTSTGSVRRPGRRWPHCSTNSTSRSRPTRRRKPQLPWRSCGDCKQSKRRAEFIPITGTPYVYGRCRECRARRARERYWNDQLFREAELHGGGVGPMQAPSPKSGCIQPRSNR